MKSTVIILAVAIMTIGCANKKQQCYIHADSRDTIKMTLLLEGKSVSGELTYNFFEKDRNTGKFNGTLSGDTIRAEYEFMSEGMMSTREVVFFKKGSKLIDLNAGGIELDETVCE